ncbi:MAG: hypothetical protein DHS20C08_20490 [Rhodomicrobium sp.]|nr:MAG: hypothetical protein DHS20C08_20490 [Rhodomicrobium sp.]
MMNIIKACAIAVAATGLSITAVSAAQPEKVENYVEEKIETEKPADADKKHAAHHEEGEAKDAKKEDMSEKPDAVKVEPGKETIELDKTQKADQKPTKHMEEAIDKADEKK